MSNRTIAQLNELPLSPHNKKRMRDESIGVWRERLQQRQYYLQDYVPPKRKVWSDNAY